MNSPTPPIYKTKNWPTYNEPLKQRGSLTIWFDPELVWVPPPTGKRSRQPEYIDAAIQTCLTLKVLFSMAGLPTCFRLFERDVTSACQAVISTA